MEFEIAPGWVFEQGRLNVMIAPTDRFITLFNESQNFQRYMTLFISGNFSRVLSHVDRTVTRFEVRRAFTSFQLKTILEENYHTVVVFEYDPTLFEGDPRMKEIIAEALQEVAYNSIVIVYAPKTDWILRQILRRVKRLFFYGESEEFLPLCDQKRVKKRDTGRYARQLTLPV
ncbi:MAG TPA: hypothetical protein PKZ65_01895 [Methanoregulaceae archaeon]|nr:hypothetical protein [Methanoregulaceae archaeon]